MKPTNYTQGREKETETDPTTKQTQNKYTRHSSSASASCTAPPPAPPPSRGCSTPAASSRCWAPSSRMRSHRSVGQSVVSHVPLNAMCQPPSHTHLCIVYSIRCGTPPVKH